MQCFFVQFRCQLGRAYDVATALADSELASEIHSTSGEYDLIAKFYVDKEVDIGRFVNGRHPRHRRHRAHADDADLQSLLTPLETERAGDRAVRNCPAVNT